MRISFRKHTEPSRQKKTSTNGSQGSSSYHQYVDKEMSFQCIRQNNWSDYEVENLIEFRSRRTEMTLLP